MKELQTITAADVGTLDLGAAARETPDPVAAKGAPGPHRGDPKTLLCRVRDHDPATKYVFEFSWPKLGADGTLGKIIKAVLVPEGGEPTFKVACPPGAEVTLKALGGAAVTFRAEAGITHAALIVSWVG